MTDVAGLVITGDEDGNQLRVQVVIEENGDRSIYNIIHAGGGDDTLIGIPYDEPKIIAVYGVELFGEDGNDKIMGSKGADTLSGGEGNDIIYYAGSGDVIDGGNGFDSFDFSSPLFSTPSSLTGVSMTNVEEIVIDHRSNVGDFNLNSVDVVRYVDRENPGDRALSFSKPADIRTVKFTGDDGWLFKGSKSDDHFDLSTSSVSFYVFAGRGADLMIGGSGVNQFRGEDGNDKLTGGASNDDFEGGSGNDVLRGGDGKDILDGGTGNDTILGGNGNDTIYTGSGDDVIQAGAGNDIINGKFTLNNLAKPSDSKVLDGGEGNDVFRGFEINGRSTTKFIGGAGTDTLEIGGDISHLSIKQIETLDMQGSGKIIADADTLDGFSKITFSGNTFSIQFSSGGHFTWDKHFKEPNHAKLTGSHQQDMIDMSAAKGFWTINGGDGNDSIVAPSDAHAFQDVSGGNGNDTLTAGIGRNNFHGDAGRDTFVFGNNACKSHIADFDDAGKDRDVIDLSEVNAIKDFSDLIKNHVDLYDGGDFVVIQSGKLQITFTATHSLDESSFIF